LQQKVSQQGPTNKKQDSKMFQIHDNPEKKSRMREKSLLGLDENPIGYKKRKSFI
jgi:hypothetical protein